MKGTSDGEGGIRWNRWLAVAASAWSAMVGDGRAAENFHLTGVPDYQWHVGCFGTASGNLGGFWDRHGFPDLYTGPTNGGLAPLDSRGGNQSILSLWASKAGRDGRPADQPGHEDDYYVEYPRTWKEPAPDPYLQAGREEHEPDCIGDFIGLSQDKWSDLNGECGGNLDAYSFVFWDTDGGRRENFQPLDPGTGGVVPDIPSGLRRWTAWRGYEADVFSQLTDFNPTVPLGAGFTFEEIRAELDAGYPVLLFMQDFESNSRDFPERPGMNPEIHGMLAYGYFIADDGSRFVRYRTSWASGDNQLSRWDDSNWTPRGQLNLPLRGVIGYRPRPRIRAIEPADGGWRVRWDGPSSVMKNATTGEETALHWYCVERTADLGGGGWEEVTEPSTSREARVDDCCGGGVFFRVRLMTAAEAGQGNGAP